MLSLHEKLTDMKMGRNRQPVVITKTSKKLENLLLQLKEHKLAQQTKLRESSMVSTGMVGSDLSRAVRISELERL